jgi:predicted transport protein
MSEIKLYNLSTGLAVAIPSQSMAIERSLQRIIEANAETMLGVRFLETEYSTGRLHGGRIDTLGVDEDGAPVIIEYKRSVNENVINQGLFYLDWLMDHKAEFKLLVMEKLGSEIAEHLDWNGPRLICIAGDFTRYDEHAVRQIERNIELMRYRRFGDELLALELVHRTSASQGSSDNTGNGSREPRRQPGSKANSQSVGELATKLQDLYESVRTYILALGEDVEERQLSRYIAYRRIRNFCSLVLQQKQIVLYLKLDPSTVNIDANYMRDVSNLGHWGTGDLELLIRNDADFVAAQPYLQRAYEAA